MNYGWSGNFGTDAATVDNGMTAKHESAIAVHTLVATAETGLAGWDRMNARHPAHTPDELEKGEPPPGMPRFVRAVHHRR